MMLHHAVTRHPPGICDVDPGVVQIIIFNNGGCIGHQSGALTCLSSVHIIILSSYLKSGKVASGI